MYLQRQRRCDKFLQRTALPTGIAHESNTECWEAVSGGRRLIWRHGADVCGFRGAGARASIPGGGRAKARARGRSRRHQPRRAEARAEQAERRTRGLREGRRRGVGSAGRQRRLRPESRTRGRERGAVVGEKEAEGREERRGGVCLLLSRALTRACALRRLLGPEGALPKVEKRLRSVAGKADQSSLVFLHAAIEELVTIRHGDTAIYAGPLY
eukprot:3938813-Rhodomonas_salina.1